jgi:hypothetical protein
MLRDLGIDDIEAFVAKYVKPKHGGGHYDVVLLDSLSREFEAGFVRVMVDPDGQGKGGDDKLIGVVQDLISRNQSMMTQMYQQPQAPQQDPIEQMRRVRELEKEMSGGNGGGNGMMMAMMMMNQPKGPDPMLMSMMQAQQQQMSQMVDVLKEIKNGSSSAAMMAPPPPPPAFDMAGLTAMLSTVAVPVILKMMENSSSKHDPNAVTKQDVQLMMMELTNRLSQGGDAPNPLEIARETIGLFRELHGGERQQSLQEKLSEMTALRELAKEVVGGNGPGRSESNFWDAALGLVSNRGLGEGLGKMLGTAMDRFGAPQQPSPGPQVVSFGAARPAGVLPAQQPTQAAPAVQQPGTQVQQTPQAQPQITIPDDFPALMEKVETAPTDQARVEAVINAIYSLRGHEQWREFVHSLLGATAKNEKETALRGLFNWLKLIVENRLLSGGAADRVMKTFVAQWEAIHTTIATLVQGAMPTSPAAPAVVTPAPQAPATVVASGPAPGQTDDDEDDDGPDGPADIELPPDMQHPGQDW